MGIKSALSQRGSVVTKAGTVGVVAKVVDTTAVPSAVVATDCAVVDPGAEVPVEGEHEEMQIENDTSAAVNLARSTHRVLIERS